MNVPGRRAKTSTDILEEKNVLEARLRALETVLEVICRETEAASVRPELSFVTLCRVGAIARAATSRD